MCHQRSHVRRSRSRCCNWHPSSRWLIHRIWGRAFVAYTHMIHCSSLRILELLLSRLHFWLLETFNMATCLELILLQCLRVYRMLVLISFIILTIQAYSIIRNNWLHLFGDDTFLEIFVLDIENCSRLNSSLILKLQKRFRNHYSIVFLSWLLQLISLAMRRQIRLMLWFADCSYFHNSCAGF